MNDIAAAYYLRGIQEGSAADLKAALAAANRAWVLEPTSTTSFNRALVIEAVQSPEEAKKAWGEYLKFDPSSPWRVDALKHLDRFSDD